MIPTYEQFLAEYEYREEISESYKVENEAWDLEKSYGCSQSQSVTDYTKKEKINKNDGFNESKFKEIWGLGLTALTFICPPIGVAASTVTATYGTGIAITGKIFDDEEAVDFGLSMAVMGITAGISGICGANSHKVKDCKVPKACLNG